MQDTGDAMVTVGLVTTAVSGVTGVGALAGAKIALVDTILNYTGVAVELATDLITEDYDALVKDGANEAFSEVASVVLDKALPGPTPNMAPLIEKTVEATNEIIKHTVSTKIGDLSDKILGNE